MFKSLQARLTLSYLVVILICLVLVGLAALVLLRGYQERLTYSRLADRAALLAGLATQSMARGSSPQEAVDRLSPPLNRVQGPAFSVYLLDAGGEVIAGSNKRLIGHGFPELAVQHMPPPLASLRGQAQLPSGEGFYYVAHQVRAVADQESRVAPHMLLVAQPSSPVQFTLGDFLPRLIWVGLLALFLSIIVAALFAYSIARPLDRIAEAAEEIAAGNYDQELDISSPAEVARLATSFNSMARQVSTTLQSQQDLVANVSHDLKTPLTSIQGFSQALLDGTASDEAAQERAVSIIYEESSRMRRLVDELLDLARLEAGQVALAREPVNVGLLLAGCADRFAPQSERLGVALEVEVPPALPPVLGDADRLGQVFGNLIDNGLQHLGSASGEGRITLCAEQSNGSLVCSVTDNGSGIPSEDLSRVFERFYQVDKSRTRGRRGAGLGLAIAQEIIHAHGGSIRVESVEGLGTRFTVELPIGKESGQSLQSREAQWWPAEAKGT